MTSLQTYGQLDTLISYSVEMTSEDQSFTYTFAAWDRNGQDLLLPMMDDDGDTVTPPTVGASITLDGRNAFNSPITATRMVTAVAVSGANHVITLDDTFTTFSTSRTLTAGWTAEGQTTTTTTKHWAKRRDFTVRDQLDLSVEADIVVTAVRFLVRGTPARRWAVRDRFTDAEGTPWEVNGVALLGRRGEYVELLASSVS